MAELKDDIPEELAPGKYKYRAIVSTGPILIQSRMSGESAYSTVTDGSIAATEDKLINLSKGESIKVQLGAGDTFYIDVSESGLI